MANSHGTSYVLDLSYVPNSPQEQELFNLQNNFMYIVFEQCLLTSKSKLLIQLHEDTMDAQKVFMGLLQAYEEDLSGQLRASDLRAELTLMHLDDKWKSFFENFFNHWSTKVLDFERTQDSAIDSMTKRTWLTGTLEHQRDMNLP